MLSVLLTSTEPTHDVVTGVSRWMHKGVADSALLSPAMDAEGADVILFVEPTGNKFRQYARILQAQSLAIRFPERCFVYEQCDLALPFMPGLYASIPDRWFDETWTRGVPSAAPIPDPVCASMLDTDRTRWLFSFRGHPSSQVRRRIADIDFHRDDVSVALTSRFWDYAPDDPERSSYYRELRESLFVLCPVGRGASTARLYETMQLGRVPVIISDQWVPPDNIEWDRFSIRVAEEEVEDLVLLLLSRSDEARAMGGHARAVWEGRFRPGVPLMQYMMEQIDAIRRSRLDAGWEQTEVTARWGSPRFQWRHGIHPIQGAAGSIRRRLPRPSVRDVRDPR